MSSAMSLELPIAAISIEHPVVKPLDNDELHPLTNGIGLPTPSSLPLIPSLIREDVTQATLGEQEHDLMSIRSHATTAQIGPSATARARARATESQILSHAPATPSSGSSSDEANDSSSDELANLPGALFVMEDLDQVPFLSETESAEPPSSTWIRTEASATTTTTTTSPAMHTLSSRGPTLNDHSGNMNSSRFPSTNPLSSTTHRSSPTLPYPTPPSIVAPSAFSSNIIIRRPLRARYTRDDDVMMDHESTSAALTMMDFSSNSDQMLQEDSNSAASTTRSTTPANASTKRAFDEVSPATGLTPPSASYAQLSTNEDPVSFERSTSPFARSDASASPRPGHTPFRNSFETQRVNVMGRTSTWRSTEASLPRLGDSLNSLRRRSPVNSARPPSRDRVVAANVDPYDEVGLDRLGISRDRSKRRRSGTIQPAAREMEINLDRSTPETTFAPALGRFPSQAFPIDPVLVSESPNGSAANIAEGSSSSLLASTTASVVAPPTPRRLRLGSNILSDRRTSVEETANPVSPISPRSPREEVTSWFSSRRSGSSSQIAGASSQSANASAARRSLGFSTFRRSSSDSNGQQAPVSTTLATATSSAFALPSSSRSVRDWSPAVTTSRRLRSVRIGAPSVWGDSEARMAQPSPEDEDAGTAREVLQRATQRLGRADATISRVVGAPGEPSPAPTSASLSERIAARRRLRLLLDSYPSAANSTNEEEDEMADRVSYDVWARSPIRESSSSDGDDPNSIPSSSSSRTRNCLTTVRARRPRLSRNSTSIPSPEVLSSERERLGWLGSVEQESSAAVGTVPSNESTSLWGEQGSSGPDAVPSFQVTSRRMRVPTERANERWRMGQAPTTSLATTTNAEISHPPDSLATTLNRTDVDAEESDSRPSFSVIRRPMRSARRILAETPDDNDTVREPPAAAASELRRRLVQSRDSVSSSRRAMPWESLTSSSESSSTTTPAATVTGNALDDQSLTDRVAPFSLAARHGLHSRMLSIARGSTPSAGTNPRPGPSTAIDLSDPVAEAAAERDGLNWRPLALPPMLSSGSLGRRIENAGIESSIERRGTGELPPFDPFGLDAIEDATRLDQEARGLRPAARTHASPATTNQSGTGLADAISRFDAARRANERERDDLRQRQAEEGTIHGAMLRGAHDDVDMDRRPDVRDLFTQVERQEALAARQRIFRAELDANIERERDRHSMERMQERMQARHETLAALRRDRNVIRGLMGTTAGPTTSGIGGPVITTTTTTTTITTPSNAAADPSIATPGHAAPTPREAGNGMPRSLGARRRGLSDFFRGIGGGRFSGGLFDDDSLMAFFGRDSVALDPRNYLDDSEFDTSYDALLRLSEQLGDVKPKGVPKEKLAALRTFEYKDWPFPPRRASTSPNTSPVQPVATTSAVTLPDDDEGTPKLARKGFEKEERCSVCLMDYEEDDECMLGLCSHGFHRDCLSAWLKEHGTCPVCRRDHA